MKLNLRILLVGLWLLFTFSLATWWLVFGLNQLEQLQQILAAQSIETPAKFYRQHKMLIWEGGIMLFSLLVGGGALFYLVLQTQRQSLRLKEFFATFSHDLKTSLTSLRLQAESLQEDLYDRPNPLLERLLKDAVRLQVQLENSLFLANIKKDKLFIESLEVYKIVERLKSDWPETSIFISGPKASIKADSRAFESVIKNLVHNAITHGQATEVKIAVSSEANEQVTLKITDNGLGFDGDLGKLGEIFTRHTHQSGSGVGLFLVKNLLREMNGSVFFQTSPNKGLEAIVRIPGELYE